MSIKNNSRGDTIIEVLFAMTIIGIVLAAAYSVASKNLQASQLAKERAVATELATSQIDQIKILENEPVPPSGNGEFCVDVTQSTPIIASTDARCTIDHYTTKVTKNGSEYKIIIEWIPPGGSDTNKAEVELNYKDYDFSLEPSGGVAIYTIAAGGSNVVLGVSIMDLSGISERGVVYGTSNNPAFGDGVSVAQPNTGLTASFQSTLSGLTSGQVYYARAYVNRGGVISYSKSIVINDSASGSALATVTVGNPTSIAQTTTVVGGNVTHPGASLVTERGIVYATNTQQPTIANNKRAAGSGGVGSYSVSLSGLTANTTYYVRAYATNSSGTAYSSTTGNFTTLPLPANMNVSVRKIAPAAGNNTPNCTTAATLNRAGSQVTVGGQTVATNSSSIAAFSNLSPLTNHTVSVAAPAGHTVCAPASATVATGASGTTVTANFKIRPTCTQYISGYNTYYTRGTRRADLDGWYVTMNGSFPTWNTSFTAGHYAVSGTFWYQYAGNNNPANQSAQYYLYNAVLNNDPIYSMSCPS